MTSFAKWIDTFLEEKGIDGEQILTVEGESGTNYIPVEILVDAMKQAPAHEQAKIKSNIVAIDFFNRNVLDYFQHLAKAIAI